jgi:pyruvate/2-oxoglutarate/acetoin dehydrogenase E1 component/TPP-dependent pyruvate/acetoin dehydrogenase alpha subunit
MSATVSITTDLRLQLYRGMQLIRQCEEQFARSHQRGLIHGACHTYVGQEAIAVGVCAHLRRDDVVFSTHRGHGHALAKGLPPRELMAELYGRQTGCSRGRGGSMHLFAPEIGMMGTSGIVGPCILQAAGAGYTFKLLKLDRVAVAFFGDGAVNNGAFHEGVNLASIWKLPVLFVCENNQFATEVPFRYAAGNPNVAVRGAIYGLPGMAVDGNDILAIHEAARAAVERARLGVEASPWPDPATATTHVFADAAQPTAKQPSPDRGPAREITFLKAVQEALAEEMAANCKIFVLGEGIGQRGGNFQTTKGLFDLYGPERLCDTPISERGFVGLACGAAMTGSRPVVDFMFADFIMDSIGEILNQIAKMQYMSSGRLTMPILLRGCIGIGHSAATHHSGNYYPLYAHFPGLRVVVPSSPADAKGLLKRALRCNDPVLFFEHREVLANKGPVPEGDYEIEFGQANVVRAGRHLTVVALAAMVRRVMEASEQLAARGIEVEVIDPRTVAPLDSATILESVKRTGRLLIVDEAFSPFGLGAEVAAHVADAGFDDLDAPIRRLHGAYTPTPYSPTLEKAVVPQVPDIVQAITALLEE